MIGVVSCQLRLARRTAYLSGNLVVASILITTSFVAPVSRPTKYVAESSPSSKTSRPPSTTPVISTNPAYHRSMEKATAAAVEKTGDLVSTSFTRKTLVWPLDESPNDLV